MGATAKTPGMTRHQAQRLDGVLENALTGMGVAGVDVAESSELSMVAYTPALARAHARYSWAAAQQIDQPAGDIIREGYDLEDLPEWADASAIKAYLADIGSDSHMPEDRGALQALSRLYAVGNIDGGAAAVMIIADGLPAWMPVDLERVESLVSIEVLERDEITPWRNDGGAVEFYVIGTSRTKIGPASIVHHSRVILSRGKRLMPSDEWRANGWGASVLEASHGPRMALHSTAQEMGSLVLKSMQDVVYLAELEEMMCAEETGATNKVPIDERIALIARSRGQHRLIPLDAGRDGGEGEAGRPSDNMTSIARPVRGVADLAEPVENHWASSIKQPPSIALRKTPGGWNNGTNAGDWQAWGGFISSERTTWLDPRLARIIEVACAAADGPTGGRVPKSMKRTYPPLWRPTDSEQADTASKWAATDTAYSAITPLTGAQIYEQRLVQGATGMLHLDPLPVPDVDPETGAPLDPETGEPVPEDEPAPEPTEDEIAWSEAEPPADAETARALVDTGELGSTTAQAIHSMARKGEITAYRGRSATKAPLYSMVEVKNAILARNADPEPDVELDDKQDASLWRRLMARLRG